LEADCGLCAGVDFGSTGAGAGSGAARGSVGGSTAWIGVFGIDGGACESGDDEEVAESDASLLDVRLLRNETDVV
jgi:hypothetical protein